MRDVNLAEWGGVIGFAIALIASVLVCRRILCRAPRNTDTSGDKEYDKLIMSSILLRDRGTPIDKVAEVLKGQELGSFSLVGAKDSGRNL